MLINWSEQSRNDLRSILSYVGLNFGRLKAERSCRTSANVPNN